MEYGKKGHKIRENSAFIVFTTHNLLYPTQHPNSLPLSRNLFVVVRVYLVTFYEKNGEETLNFGVDVIK